MFVSPCTLRSTQCAALIALATAAGIMRVEVAEARSSDARTTKPEINRAARTELPPSAPAARFQLAFDAVAPWLALFQVAAQLPAESPADFATPRPSTAPAAPLPFPPRLCCGPTARQHSYPFAVGPPAHGPASPPLAAGMIMPGNSAAPGSVFPTVSRVAHPDEVSSAARLARLIFPSHALAGSAPKHPFALRGEPPPRPHRRTAPSALRARFSPSTHAVL